MSRLDDLLGFAWAPSLFSEQYSRVIFDVGSTDAGAEQIITACFVHAP